MFNVRARFKRAGEPMNQSKAWVLRGRTFPSARDYDDANNDGLID